MARRRQGEDFLQIGNEAHVEHAVRFIDHKQLNARQQEFASPEMVEQAARGRDQNVGTSIEDLPAGQKRRRQSEGQQFLTGGIGFEILGDLCRQFTGRRDDQRAGHTCLGAASR